MSRRVNQVEDIGLPVLGSIIELDGIKLNGDTALPLQVHAVQELGLHFPAGNRLSRLQNPVSQGWFPVVDVGNDGEIANLLLSFFQIF